MKLLQNLIKKLFICIMIGNIFDKLSTLLVMSASALAIMSLKSIFDNDNSRIISQDGKNVLSNKEKMESINKKISTQDTDVNSKYSEVII